MSGLWQMRDGGEMDEEAALSGGAARRSLPPTDGNNLRRTSTYGEDWDQEERDLIERRQAQPGWRVDRGAGFYQEERRRHKRPSLVETGRHAGRSRVTLEGIEWGVLLRHVLKRDFFNYSVNAPIGYILLALCVCYFLTVSAWALTYYITWKFYGQCFHGFEDSGLVSAFLFSVETQQTIGYGSRFPGDCWLSAALIASHSVESIILDSLVLGIALARISHPKNRGRTILLSDCAVVSRRDGILKFMFRVADMQKTQVVAPHIKAFLFTWGEGRTTSEQEHFPVIPQEILIDDWDRTMLLPTVITHTIDESSPLFGQTARSLEALGAEIVVTFEGSTELGDMFMVRQSYLPQELHWGHVFANVIRRAEQGETQHCVDLSRFHDIEPQPHLQTMPPWQLSAKIVSQITRIVPPPLLYENTLCLSDEGVVSMRDGKLYLMFRVGDTYPTGQVEDVNVEAYIYRWQEYRTAEGELIQYQVGTLLMSPKTPTLRYPSVVTHEICEGSPLESWTSQQGLRKDADAEVVVTVKGNLIGRTRLVTRTRVYPVMSGIKWGGTFVPILARGATPGTVHVDWSGFHLHVPNETAHRTLPRVQSHRDVRASAPSDVRPPAPPAGHSLPDTFGSPVFTGEVGGADAWERHRAGERAGPDAAPGGTGGTQFWDGGGGPPLGPAGLPSAARAGSFSSGALSGAAGAAAAAPRPGALVLAPLEGLGLFGRGSQQQQRDSSLGAGPESPTCVRASASSGSGEPGRQSGRLGGGSATHFGAQGGDEWHATRNLFDAIANMQERYAEEAEEATRADLLLQPHP